MKGALIFPLPTRASGPPRLLSAAVWALTLILGLSSCHRNPGAREEAAVQLAFESCKRALINRQADQALTYFPRNVHDYFQKLNARPPAAISPPSDFPGVDLLLRTALDRKVPAELRPALTLSKLMQRIADRRLLSPRDVAAITLGRVTVAGDRASAEIYDQDALTALRLPFIREDGRWKIDILAILPYAEVLMRVDRAWKGQTESQQVEQLVKKLPSL